MFNTSRLLPYACDPSNLPKYPPNKEYDAKLRYEETRREQLLKDKKLKLDRGSNFMHPMAIVDCRKPAANFGLLPGSMLKEKG